MSTDKDNQSLPAKSDFQIMDDQDCKQIENLDSGMQQALAYKTKYGKIELSLTGIKWIIRKMAEKDQPIQVDLIECVLIKHDENNKNDWVWYATVKAMNKFSNLESIGASEQHFNDRTKGYIYDNFGRLKAISKATRNAFRHQIAEAEIKLLIESLDKKQILTLKDEDYSKNSKPVSSTSKYCTCTGEIRLSNNHKTCLTCVKGLEPSKLKIVLYHMKQTAKEPEKQTSNEIDYCKCEEPKPKFQKDESGFHNCFGCSKPVKPDEAKKLLAGDQS